MSAPQFHDTTSAPATRSAPIPSSGQARRHGRMLALLGPTASGKSRLAMQVALAHAERGIRVEIVAIDAFTVYRGMDVGTAKASIADRAQVPHHLVDLLDPHEDLTVAAFQHLARAAIGEVLDRGALPLLVGGSGLYWRAVVDDLRFPPTDAQVRARIEQQWGENSDAAHAYLATRDPDAAASIAPENVRRTIRALEVIELTGERFSTFADAWQHYRSIYPDLEVAGLDPDTAWLRDQIRERAIAMVDAGLLEEAAGLRDAGPLSRTAAQGIGYAEAFAVLDGDLDAAALADVIATRTWRYARRQRSWFRADPRVTAAEPDELLVRWSAP